MEFDRASTAFLITFDFVETKQYFEIVISISQLFPLSIDLRLKCFYNPLLLGRVPNTIFNVCI